MQMQPIAVAAREMPDPDRAAVTASAIKAATPPEPVSRGADAGAAEPSHALLSKAVDNINRTMRGLSQQLEFTIDDDSKRLVVKVVDQQTGDVIRQMPSAEALEIAKALDRLQGLLIRQQA